MKIGFTGTQWGMSNEQRAKLVHVVGSLIEGEDEMHHGVCIGADQEFHLMMTNKFPDVKRIGHPPMDTGKMARLLRFDETRPPKGYLARNDDIVDETDVLIACAREDQEKLRSGTWATVRRARAANKLVIRINRDGAVIREEVKSLAKKHRVATKKTSKK